MTNPFNPNLSCDEIIQLINEMVDDEIDPERLEIALNLVSSRPECKALYESLKTTITLYRMRNTETKPMHFPEIHWPSDTVQNE